MSNPYVNSLFQLLLIEQILGKSKSARAESKVRLQFWHGIITPDLSNLSWEKKKTGQIKLSKGKCHNESFFVTIKTLVWQLQSSYGNHGECYKKLASRWHTLLFCWKIKSCCYCCSPQQIIPQNTVKLYMLADYSFVRTGFNMINKHHILSVIYTMLV